MRSRLTHTPGKNDVPDAVASRYPELVNEKPMKLNVRVDIVPIGFEVLVLCVAGCSLDIILAVIGWYGSAR